MGEKIVIIGAGQAACSCAAKLRKNNQDCEIVLIGDEKSFPYQRPPLSKKYATGDMTREQLLLRPADWFANENIVCKSGIRVEQVDRILKTLKLSNGDTEPYDKLVFTTGSKARRLPDAMGGNLENVLVLRDLDDADKIASLLQEGKHVLIIGGGYIGLEAAAVCASKGMDVTLIEAADRILKRVACSETSDWFRALHASKGVKILEDCGLKAFEENAGKITAEFEDGAKLNADFVLVGIGIEPNAGLAKEAGLETNIGIVVNDYCQTSDDDIYAAGDCSIFPYKSEPTRLESVQNAIDQAECAADNINGERRDYRPFPWFWSDQYDVKLQIAGLNRGFNNTVIREGEREGSRSHFYFDGDTLLAVDAMNDPRTYMVAKKVLEAGQNITPDQAADRSITLKDLM